MMDKFKKTVGIPQIMKLRKMVIFLAVVITFTMITFRQSDCNSSKNHLEKVWMTRRFTRLDEGNKNLQKRMRNIENLGLGINKYARMVNGNRRQCYNIGLWNCRKGLIGEENLATEKMVEVEQFMREQKLHMLCLVESDLHGPQSRIRRRNPITESQIRSSLKIEGYRIILPQSWEVHGQARVILYVKEEIKIKVIPLARELTDLPCITCQIGTGKEKKTIVSFFYREWTSGVSGLAEASQQNERLRRQVQHWKTVQQGNKDIIVLGDANLCAHKWEDEGYPYKELAGQILDYLGETLSFQMVTQKTRHDLASSSCLDHCYSNVPEKIVSTKAMAVGNSDHLGIVVRKLSKFPASRPQTIRKRSYKNFNAEAFLSEILASNINQEVVNKETLEEAAETFEYKFKEVLDNHAPEKVIQLRKNYHPYISEETKRQITDRKDLQMRAVNGACREVKKEFNKKNKEVKKAILEDKKNYFKTRFNEGDSRNAWRTANDLLGTVKNLSPTIILHRDEEDDAQNMITNPERIAEIFNEFFIQKVRKLRQKSRMNPSIRPAERLRKWLRKRESPPPPFSLKTIGMPTLRKAIKRMKGKKTSGVDSIDSYSLKLAAPLMEEALLHLVNLSIEESSFSKKWKPQLIFPNHKKKDRMLVENYRPVSNLVETGKLVEYVIAEQILSHFIENNLFHINHHGSLPAHSTATALIQLTDMWIEAAEKKEFTGVCMLDQSAAYDLLDFEIFEEKLKEYNFDEASISWVRSYLSGRSQCVRVESKQSKFTECEESGAPQGSVMAGIFHIINSNDLPDCHEEAESIVYVDDNTDSVHDGDPDQLMVKLQNEVDKTVEWLKDNRMCVAGDKSKILIVGTRELRATRITDEKSLIIDGNRVAESKSERLLGVVVNNILTWKEHLYGDEENTGLINQLKQRVGTLRRLSKYVEKDRLKMLANGLFYSKLVYCLPVFGNVSGLERYDETVRMRGMTSTDCCKLQVQQNNVNRILTGTGQYTSTAELLQKTGTLSVHQMIAYYTLLMVFKVIKTGKPSYLSSKLRVTRDDGVARRGLEGSTITTPNYLLGVSRAGFIYRGAKLFNMLPGSIRELSETGKFKAESRRWIQRNIKEKPGS